MQTENQNTESLEVKQPSSFFEKSWGYIALFLVAVNIFYFFCYDPKSPYALSRSLWYADFRFWPEWASTCCWLVFAWGVLSLIFSILIPQNKDRLFLIRRAFYQNSLSIFFVILTVLIWYSYSTLPLATVFSPLLSPLVDYIYHHYTLPLADYYTTSKGASPLFWPVLLVAALTILFVSWRIWFYFKRWKRTRNITALVLLAFLPVTLGANESAVPKKVETSVGIYDVQSKDDLLSFTAEDIRELVRIEDDRIRGAGKPPHPILVYCFEERSFQYTGGRYENAEIKYRLRVPQKIVPGKKYPLVVHLHGVGEAEDNMLSLAHLHSILPLMVGPEQQDFFLLVLQCPPDNRVWTFKPEKDGNLDVVIAAADHVIQNNPIDTSRLSTFGLSSGGYGVWEWIIKEPDKFSSAVPASCGATLDFQKLTTLKHTAIWTFRNKSDGNAPIESIREAMLIINGSGSYMKLTQFDQGGHAAWRPAMDEYNCFAWMIAQKRSGWFNPPPERKVYQGRSLSESFYAFFLPLILAGGLFLFQRTALCERLHERIADRLYRRWDEDEEYEDDDDEEEDSTGEGFRVLTDITGAKKIKAKVLGFQGDAVRIESPNGQIAAVAFKNFAEADQQMLQTLRDQSPPPGDGFRIWTDTTGAKKITAKLVDFLPDGKVRLESETGKVMTVDPKFFCEDDQQFLAQLKKPVALPEGFRKWSNAAGTQSFIAKFVGFQGGDKVLLQSQAGKTMPVPINQLGQAEQDFLAQEREQTDPAFDDFRTWSYPFHG